MSADRPLIVTSALPYANGPLHFGHVAGAYLPADLHVRFERLRGTDVLYICGTDEHGVAITVNAEKEGIGYREYVDRWHAEIVRLFELFGISFDHFSRTSNEQPHYPLSQEVFLRLLREGAVAPKTTRQHFCLSCDRFLPDRFVEGTCYVCNEPSARGDECKACGSWLEAVRIVEPRCATCGNTPEVRDTMQYELDLSPVSDEAVLRERFPHMHHWLHDVFAPALKSNVRSTVMDKLVVEGEGLKGRPITRDLRWGVPVPSTDLDGNEVEGHDGKVLYVWFDAPIGYVSATMEWARDLAERPEDWRRYWITPTDAADGTGPRLLHFLGKDNIPFHCVVFPAMLAMQSAAGEGDDFLGPGVGERWVLPENVPANEFYNLEGRKFSTSDRWYLDSAHMFETFGADALRWYMTVSMPETSDTQFKFDGFAAHVNADLNDTIGNYAARVLKFVRSKLGGSVPEPGEAFEHEVPVPTGAGETETRSVNTVAETRARLSAVFAPGTSGAPTLTDRLANHEYRRAAEAALAVARLGNLWFDAHQPWKSRKLDDMTDCHTSLWCHCQILSALAVALWPFMPGTANTLREMLGLPCLSAAVNAASPAKTDERRPVLWRFWELPAGHELGEPGILFAKIDDDAVAAEKERLGSAAS